MKTISVTSSNREEMLDITSETERVLREAGATEGICVLFTQHTTCGPAAHFSSPHVSKGNL